MLLREPGQRQNQSTHRLGDSPHVFWYTIAFQPEQGDVQNQLFLLRLLLTTPWNQNLVVRDGLARPAVY